MDSLNPSRSPTTGQDAPASRIRRRNRMITSCLECRRRKLKCSKSHPCTNCLKFSRDCVFLAPALDQASQLKLTEIKEKVGSLERLLERDVANNVAIKQRLSSSTLPEGDIDDIPPTDDEPFLEVTPMAVLDAAYEMDGNDDEVLDLGIQLGKMRMTERIGGFFRPKISQEVGSYISDREEYFPDEEDNLHTPPLPPANEWLKPGPAYIAPASGFFFGNNPQQSSLIDFLPSKLAADRLVKQYFIAVHPIAQILHRQTFEREYETFWDEVSLGIEPPSSVQAIVFAVMFSGVVSTDDSDIVRDFGVSKASLVDNFRQGTETALGRANFLRTTKIETLQGFVMYLIPLCRAEVSRAHSVLVGAAIRMAECMGLHRDGEHYGLSALETHVRRLIWYQLCFLDIRTCEAQGPRPSIQRDAFDTKLPLNLDDVDFDTSNTSPAAKDRWTDSTFCLIRFEVNEMMRIIWVDRPKVDRRKLSLTALLRKVEQFREKLAAKYDHMMDARFPIQRHAIIGKALLISRLYIMVLHRYNSSPMPDRLRELMVLSGATMLETAIALETIPELQQWNWYGGAFQQYHTAFLMLMCVYHFPEIKYKDRIWPCLDYIYECVPHEPRTLKARKILLELQRKTAIYQSMRGMLVPVTMEKELDLNPGILASFRSSEETKTESPSFDQSQNYPGVSQQQIGKAPIDDVILATASSSEAPWDASNNKNVRNEMGSMQSSQVVGPESSADEMGDVIAEIDWGVFDELFPPDQLIYGSNEGLPLYPSYLGQ